MYESIAQALYGNDFALVHTLIKEYVCMNNEYTDTLAIFEARAKNTSV